jgi:hypothetical protein
MILQNQGVESGGYVDLENGQLSENESQTIKLRSVAAINKS